MDPLSALLFLVIGFCLFGLYRRFTSNDKQLYRLVSDAESEKGTRRRINSDIENRLRSLEGKPQLPHDDQTKEQGNG